ncbi:MAG: Rieske (2Fe-2S) protein [Nitrososphaerota archaeon]|nr:Rieske (2Fe-2S) protein [Candidatus Nezhaarchaeota archaeon]MDW8050052.1 Rieske (2Fe-2S) protein [Nitrososphaerota archaeon]
MKGGYARVCSVNDVPRGGMKLVKVRGFEILIVNIDGDFYAYDNRCPHMGYPLFLGTIDGWTLICGFHYAKFDIKSGKPLNNVSEKPLKKIKLRRLNSELEVDLSSLEGHLERH